MDEEIFHYTNRYGLIGILKSCRMWASAPYYLNDLSEGTLGYTLLLNRLEAEARALDGSDDVRAQGFRRIKEFAKRQIVSIPGSYERIRQGEYYVASFTPNGDDLNQWLTYGAFGNCYAIGFRTQMLAELERTQAVSLIQCNYSEQLHGDLLTAFDGAAGLAYDAWNLPDAEFEKRAMYVVSSGVRGALGHKHPSFVLEEEHRLLVRGSVGREVCFREGKRFPMRYVEIDLTEQFKEGLISRVIVGPGPDIETDLLATGDFVFRQFGSAGFPPPAVSKSASPYRG